MQTEQVQTVQLPVGTTVAEAQRRLTLATLDACEGNKRVAAELLGISLKTLYNKLAVYEAQDRARRYALQQSA